MVVIQNIFAREILDSRGHPTVEVDVLLSDGSMGRASVPSGASTGVHEALELRDSRRKRFGGWGVLKAIRHINQIILPGLLGFTVDSQEMLDECLIELDGTNNKSHLGANATLAVSLAVARAKAHLQHLPLYRSLSKEKPFLLPVPMMNILNGGKHADNPLDIQEFMIVPVGAKTFSQSLRIGSEVFYALKEILKKKNMSTNVGDEGGFAPNIQTTRQALELLVQAVEMADYRLDKDVSFALDVASSSFYSNNLYHFEGNVLSASEMIKFYHQLCSDYPIVSIEDGLAEDDWKNWEKMTKQLGKGCQLVGDDLFVTQTSRLEYGIENHSANAILIKPNQVGTLTETLQAIEMAKNNHYHTIISHRSGETEDTFIADLAVATNAGQIKTGSLSRTDRIAKYNQLLRIEEELGKRAQFLGKKAFKF